MEEDPEDSSSGSGHNTDSFIDFFSFLILILTNVPLKIEIAKMKSQVNCAATRSPVHEVINCYRDTISHVGRFMQQIGIRITLDSTIVKYILSKKKGGQRFLGRPCFSGRL